ncbi:MAG: hypothetical protein J5774_04295, partial [Clostridia bacterium]|nr:hypothetical protein [Clostridia bacterium]
NNSVDDARAIRDNVRYAPVDCKYKVYIIDEVHQLSGAAFNALLKTLEEPPAHAVFVLATTEVQKIPATIMSRCLRLDFHLVPQETLEEHVDKIFDLEGVKYTKEGVSAIAAAGEGSVRDTLSVADMCVSYSDVVDYESVLGVLGANDPQMIAKTALAALSGDIKGAVSLVEEAASLGKSVQMLTRDLTKYFRDLIIIKHDPGCNVVLKLPNKLFDAAAEIAKSFDSVTLMRALDIFSGIEAKSRYSNQPKILLETAIIKTATLSGEELSDLIAKVSAIEGKIKEIEQSPAQRPDYSAIKKMLTPTAPVQSAPEAPAQAPVMQETPAFDLSGAKPVDALPFDVADPGVNSAPKDLNEVTAFLPQDIRDQMTKLRGRVLGQLRNHPLKMLYISLGGEGNDTLMNLRDGKITIAFKKEMDFNYCNTPRNIEELKRVISAEIGEPVDVELVNCNESAKGALSTSDILKLFAGAEKININRGGKN